MSLGKDREQASTTSQDRGRLEKWYFESWHAYHKKRSAIRALYCDFLKWAASRSPFNLFKGAGRKALDVGCAHGYLVELLLHLGYEAYGCDVSRLYVHRYARNLTGNLVVCDAQKLPFRWGSYDLITCFEVLEHLQDPSAFLGDCYRLLMPQGVLLLQTPWAIPTIDALFSRLYAKALLKASSVVEHHVSEFRSKEEVERLLKHHGFKGHVERWFLLPLNPLLFDRYFPTRLPISVPTFRIIGVKQR
ncbi:MAG: methyltransferase domain-containing protein [Candidatus Nezhaarchaeales archaeon]